MTEEVLRRISRDVRAKPIRGGKKTCCKCDAPHLPGHGYCREHRNQYARDRRTALKERELHRKEHAERLSRENHKLRELLRIGGVDFSPEKF